MDSNLRSISDKPPTFHAHPPPHPHQHPHPHPQSQPPLPPVNYSYFSEQAIRAGYSSSADPQRPDFPSGGDSRRLELHIPVGSRRPEFPTHVDPRRPEFAIPVDSRLPDFARSEHHRVPNDMRELVQREMEKERIRAEIIAEEMARRRMLEEEVRRELMMERLAMEREGGESFSRFGSTMRHDMGVPLLKNFENRGVEERAMRKEFPGHESLPFERVPRPAAAGKEFPGHELLPFEKLPWSAAAGNGNGNERVGLKEMKIPAFEALNEKAMIMDKPETRNLKRKAPMPATGYIQHSKTIWKDQPRDQWRCALCNVTAVNEHTMNLHLKGKKHKANELGLTDPLPKTNIASTSKPIINSGESSKNKKEFAAKAKGNSKVMKLRKKGIAANGKKFTYWCAMCAAGAFDQVVMDSHYRGKKHLALLEKKRNQSVGAGGAN